MTARGKTTPTVGAHGLVETPAWCVDRLMEKWRPHDLGSGTWVDCGAGAGGIIRAVRPHYSPTFHAIELQARFKNRLYSAGADIVTICDYLTQLPPRLSDVTVVIGNPLFSIAQETHDVFRDRCPDAEIVLLLPLSYLEAEERHRYVFGKEPDLYVMPQRPSFREDGHTDAQAYGWFRWGPRDQQEGKIRLLDLTPLRIRRP